MLSYSFGRVFGLALALYGVLGVFIAAALLVLGTATFSQIAAVATAFDAERMRVAASIRTVAGTVNDTATATGGFQASVNSARVSADGASKLAFETSISFRQLADGMNIQILGVLPFATVVPRFQASADQLEQLAIALGSARDDLQQSGSSIAMVGQDLLQVQAQLRQMSDTLDRSTSLKGVAKEMLPFQVAFYGMCLLVGMQSLISVIAGLALLRLVHTPGTRPLTIVGRRHPSTASPTAE